jgi:uncharacterized membrane protein HdeD (DUF308 family)
MITTPLFLGVENLREKWGWLLALGIVLIVLGCFALYEIPAATLATVLILAWIMVFSGIVEAIHAFSVQGWGGMFLHLIGGILGILVGLLIVTHPVAGALVWTILFAAFFTTIGVFRTIAAIRLQFPKWGWAVLDGLVTLALGIILWIQWPYSGLWFLGVALGVSLLLRGWSYVMFALAVHSLPVGSEIRRAA